MQELLESATADVVKITRETLTEAGTTLSIKPAPTDITIANYSAILTSYELMMSNSVSVAQGQKRNNVLIVQPFWLDHVHQSRLDTPWGQHVREFPPNVSKLFKEMYPEISAQERVSFAQVKSLRSECINRLKRSPNYEVIEGNCESIALLDDEPRHLKIVMKDGRDYHFEIANDTKIYNFAQVPRTDTLGLNLPPQTELYKLPKGEEPKRVIVFGAGLSSVWVKEQALNSLVRVVIRNETSEIPPEIARNKNNPIIKSECLYMNQSRFFPLNRIMTSDKVQDAILKTQIIEFAQQNTINLELLGDNAIVAFKKPEQEDQSVGQIHEIGVGYVAFGFETDYRLCEDFLNKCYLIKLENDPMQIGFPAINTFIKNKNAIIMHNNELYFADQACSKIIKINIPSSIDRKERYYDQLKKIVGSLKTQRLSDMRELGLICALTEHQQYHHVQVACPQTSKPEFYAPKNIPFDAFFGRHESHKRSILEEKYRVSHINLSALVIKEDDKPLLKNALGVYLRFIDYLCNEIKNEEDTPQNVKKFILDKYKSWSMANKTAIDPRFESRLDSLLHRISKRSTTYDPRSSSNFFHKSRPIFPSLLASYGAPLNSTGPAVQKALNRIREKEGNGVALNSAKRFIKWHDVHHQNKKRSQNIGDIRKMLSRLEEGDSKLRLAGNF